jgi:hypothetical protein
MIGLADFLIAVPAAVLFLTHTKSALFIWKCFVLGGRKTINADLKKSLVGSPYKNENVSLVICDIEPFISHDYLREVVGFV